MHCTNNVVNLMHQHWWTRVIPVEFCLKHRDAHVRAFVVCGILVRNFCLLSARLTFWCLLGREAQLEAAVAALQRGLSAARREADGSVNTTKYMQAWRHTLHRPPHVIRRYRLITAMVVGPVR